MSVQPSLLKCPSCPDQMLETVTTALGSLERCPACLSLWVEQKLIAAYSDDKTACRVALAETKALLLPADRWCPKCFQKMVDGRVRSRGVVLHLCVTCEALWTDWNALRKFDEFVERALKAQVEAASQPPLSPQASTGPSYTSGPAVAPAWTQIEDTAMGKVFRSMARTFDSIADGVGGTSAYTQMNAPKPANKKPPAKAPTIKPKGPAKEDKGRKILKADELPPEPIVSGAGTGAADTQAVPAPEPISIRGIDITDIETQAPVAPEPVSRTETASPETPTPTVPEPVVSSAIETPIADVKAEVVPEPVPAPVEIPAVEPIVIPAIEEKVQAIIPDVPAEAPEDISAAPKLPSIFDFIEKEKEPAPLPPAESFPPAIPIEDKRIEKAESEPLEAKIEPQIEPQAEPQKEPQNASSAISNLLGGSWDDEEKEPAKKNKKPIVPKPGPVAKPLFSKPPGKGPGLFGKLGSVFKPKPKTPKPIVPVMPDPIISGTGTSAADTQAAQAPTPAPDPIVSETPNSMDTQMAPNKPALGPAPILKKTGPAPVKKAPEIKPVKKESSGKGWGLFKSKSKTPKPAPAIVPEEPVPLAPVPLAHKPEPVAAPAPDLVISGTGTSAADAQAAPRAIPKPVLPKPVAKPKAVKPKTKRGPAVLALRLLPWMLAVVAFLINYARGYDFELSFALLWSVCAWSIGTMIRLFLLYPFQDFMEISLSALLDYPGLTPAKGFPVILKGWLEPENPDIPKGPLIFTQDEKKLLLNKTGALEFASTFFGLKNPAQFLPGEVTLHGWYRKTEPPYLEVSVVLMGKRRRASMVRAVRWAVAIGVLVVAGLILMTAE